MDVSVSHVYTTVNVSLCLQEDYDECLSQPCLHHCECVTVFTGGLWRVSQSAMTTPLLMCHCVYRRTMTSVSFQPCLHHCECVTVFTGGL